MAGYGDAEFAADDVKPGGEGDDYETKREPKADAECVKRYWAEIARYEKATSTWYEQADQIIARYLDDNHSDNSERRFAMLYANIETLKPSIYAKLPIALCERRYRDRDPIGRVAAEIMERCVNTTLDIGGLDEIFRLVRDDRLLPGRGQAWVRYHAEIEQVQGEAIDIKTRQKKTITHDKLKGESIKVDYVYWRYHGHNLARVWSNVWLVWRICYYSKFEATEQWGKKIADKLKYDSTRKGDDKDDIELNCCEVYEVWDSRKKLMSIISKGWPKDEPEPTIDSGPPPISFSRFFPCPEPCFATKTSRSLIPVPDYHYYRDQAKDIDDLTAKISNMLDWLRVKAFIPRGTSSGGADAIEQAITDSSNDDIFIHVSSWAQWVEKGGAKGLIDWLPVDMVVKALAQAIQVRNQLIQDVYQITGISDILRGQTDPEETFGAQNIKNNTGSRRLRNAKDEQARFCEDICRLVAEAAAENFQPETLAQMSGFLYTPGKPTQPPVPQVVPASPLPAAAVPQPLPAGSGTPQPGVEAIGANGGPPMQPDMPESPMTFGDDVVELLRNDRLRMFRIKVETDSTTQPDDDKEKQRRTEFLNTVAAYLEKATAAIQMAPALGPAIKEFLMFTARGFRVGRNMETVIEDAIDKLVQQAQQPKEDKIDAVSKAKMQQADQQHAQKMEQSDKQFQQTLAQNDQQHTQKMAQSDAQFQENLAIEREKNRGNIERDEKKAERERVDNAVREVSERNARIEDRDHERTAKREDADGERKAKREDAEIERQAKRDDRDQEAGLTAITEMAKKVVIPPNINQGLENLARQVAKIMDEMGAPIDLIQDPKTKRLIGAKRGSRMIPINRGEG